MRRGRLIGAAVLILVGLALWSSAGKPPKSAPAVEQRVSEAALFTAQARAPAPVRQHLRSADGHDPNYGPGALPHPITDDHRRLYRDADLLHEAQAALADGDAPRARTLLAQHAHEYPQTDADREGLLIMADCVAQPGLEVRRQAQRFYDQYTASAVRKRLRRTCLESRE